MSKKIKITQTRSTIGRIEPQKRVMQALGLHRIRHSVVQENTASIRGMVNKVRHLVKVEEVDGE